jgi:hypothetical protein
MVKLIRNENGGRGGPTIQSPVWAALLLQLFIAGVTIAGTVTWMKADIHATQTQLTEHVRHQDDELAEHVRRQSDADKLSMDIVQRLARLETGVEDIKEMVRARDPRGGMYSSPTAPGARVTATIPQESKQ